ncbi:hypothetical protein BN2476_480020 [Paraburkholderia piptadeniae]|uniref:Uncharacterized protein n=1 Tax=Paraburkholderia piptadeniae TaxID=1701573 RepID=A0A1N7SEI0_9BURK|nr:hypothetical protein BN2476_480020 [Paraburkholderia piptadeniae]
MVLPAQAGIGLPLQELVSTKDSSNETGRIVCGLSETLQAKNAHKTSHSERPTNCNREMKGVRS